MGEEMSDGGLSEGHQQHPQRRAGRLGGERVGQWVMADRLRAGGRGGPGEEEGRPMARLLKSGDRGGWLMGEEMGGEELGAERGGQCSGGCRLRETGDGYGGSGVEVRR